MDRDGAASRPAQPRVEQGHRPPEGWGIQSDFSSLAANLGQKGGRVKTCKWWIEVGVGWQEVDEDLGGDLVGECQYWVTVGIESPLNQLFLRVSVRNAKRDRSRSKILVSRSTTRARSAARWHEINILALTHLRTLSLTFVALFVHTKHMPEHKRQGSWYPALDRCRSPLPSRTPHITRLEFGYVNLTSDPLRTVILHAPSITHLKLRDCNYCFDDGLAGALYDENDVAPVLPHLHNLVFKVDKDKYAFTEANLAGIIRGSQNRFLRVDSGVDSRSRF
ncbi:hypothetical protein K438DRAFT_1754360 [Mycena galopus ATCC 62051]|nr:hypothetical protein K438DRAFT_1754360 [Mycena galopus ATCC 62051]